MRIIYLTLLLAAACAASMRAQAPAWADAWSYPMVGTEQPVGAGIDATGNIYVAVHARDFTVEDPARAITQLLVSSSPTGTRRWTRTFLSGAPSRRGAMDVDDDGNVYVAASFSGDTALVDRGDGFDTLTAPNRENMLVAKYDADGKLLWHLVVPGSDSIGASGLAATPAGIWIGGTFTGMADFGGTQLASTGGSDVFMAMLNGDGTFRRAMRAGGGSTDACGGIAADNDGNAVMIGQFRGTASFGGETVTATGRANFFLAFYRSDGTVAWARNDGGSDFTPASNFTPTPLVVAMDDNDNITVAISYLDTIAIDGNVLGSVSESDAIVVQYRPDGIWTWASWFPGEVAQTIDGLSIDPDGIVYVSGFSQDLPMGTLFLTKLRPDGERDWELYDRPSPTGGASGGPILFDALHNIFVVGHFGGRTSFGAHRLASQGSDDNGSAAGDDIFIARTGAASGVAMNDAAAPRPSFAIAQRDGRLLLLPAPDAPALMDAALYSMLGERVASTSGRGTERELDIDGLTRGAYLLVVRTANGTRSYRVMTGR